MIDITKEQNVALDPRALLSNELDHILSMISINMIQLIKDGSLLWSFIQGPDQIKYSFNTKL